LYLLGCSGRKDDGERIRLSFACLVDLRIKDTGVVEDHPPCP
jgi:hypothetical protein